MMIGLDTDAVRALLSHPIRLAILAALSDGAMWTTAEIAKATGLKPAVLRSHIVVLRDAGLVDTELHEGRHLHRIGDPEIGAALKPATQRRTTSIAASLHGARMCYDHLAGKLGVTLTQTMIDRKFLTPTARDFKLTERGERLFQGLGIELAALRRQRRHFARQCIDGSERRPHLAGGLGAALAGHMLEPGWIEHQEG
ncbi:MAG: winged helix-turn-helix transcriptional regulator, partial [Rhodospirillaceae bacterium]|nr:winged helix-turn-helix transcriptional regulator [Rhodospirillaceae bacterium]